MTQRREMIKKSEYESDLKPYYDYQRKVAYNKEKIFEMAHKFDGRMFNTQYGEVAPSDFGQHLWDRIPPEEYEEPPKDWVPKDEKYRIEGEGISIGRKVVLRAKQAVDK